eukprot:IDg10289t1
MERQVGTRVQSADDKVTVAFSLSTFWNCARFITHRKFCVRLACAAAAWASFGSLDICVVWICLVSYCSIELVMCALGCVEDL